MYSDIFVFIKIKVYFENHAQEYFTFTMAARIMAGGNCTEPAGNPQPSASG